MPVPVLVRPPVPPIAPEKVVAPPDRLTVRVWPPSVTEPAPLSEPIVSAAPSSSVAPELTVTAPVSAMALPPETASVPVLTVVTPE